MINSYFTNSKFVSEETISDKSLQVPNLEISSLFDIENYKLSEFYSLNKERNIHESLGEFSDIIEKIRGILKENVVEIEKANPFFNTDLIIFNDDYKGTLPLNGITKKEFDEIDKLFNKIKSNENPLIKIDTDVNESFQEVMLDSILMLLTRPLGRQLFRELMQGDRRVFITKDFFPISYHDKEYKVTTVYLPEEMQYIDQVFCSTGITMEKPPIFILLAHELIHAIHENLENANSTATLLHNDFSDVEEQVTIFGIIFEKKNQNAEISDEELRIDAFETEGFDLELEILNTPKTENLNSLNENSIRSQFGLPTRWGHSGQLIPYYKDPDTNSIIQAIYSADINELSALHQKKAHVFDQNILSIISEAINSQNLKTIKILLEWYPQILDLDPNLLYLALNQKNFLIFSEFLNTGFELSDQMKFTLINELKEYSDDLKFYPSELGKGITSWTSKQLYLIYQRVIGNFETIPFKSFADLKIHCSQLAEQKKFKEFLNEVDNLPSISLLMKSELLLVFVNYFKESDPQYIDDLFKIYEKCLESNILGNCRILEDFHNNFLANDELIDKKPINSVLGKNYFLSKESDPPKKKFKS